MRGVERSRTGEDDREKIRMFISQEMNVERGRNKGTALSAPVDAERIVFIHFYRDNGNLPTRNNILMSS